MTTFYLVRHAEKDGPADLLSGQAPGAALSATGRLQAECLAGVLAGESIQRVVSSPLRRASETARVTAERLGIEIELSDALRDIDFGNWTNETVESLKEDAEWQRHHRFRSGHRIPDGELLLEVQTRFVREVLRLDAELDAGGVALFSHSDPVSLAVAYFAGMPLDLFGRIVINSASISIVSLSEWGPRIECVNRRVD